MMLSPPCVNVCEYGQDEDASARPCNVWQKSAWRVHASELPPRLTCELRLPIRGKGTRETREMAQQINGTKNTRCTWCLCVSVWVGCEVLVGVGFSVWYMCVERECECVCVVN